MSSGNFIDFIDLTFKCSEETFNKILLELEKEGLLEAGEKCHIWNLCFHLEYFDEEGEGFIDMEDYEVSRHFEDHLKILSKVLHKCGTQLEGYYVGECDNDLYRADIKPIKRSPYIKIESAGARWVLDYSVDQINKLGKLAKEKFN